MATNSTVRGEERRAAILATLAGAGSVQLDAIAAELAVSPMTVRRDLDELEALGAARRVRGGAIALGPEHFSQRHRHNARAKARIAGAWARMPPMARRIVVPSTVKSLEPTSE
mgnify:CR=1 FL=1